MTEDELRIAIVQGRRITRDARLLALIDALEELLNSKEPVRRKQILVPGQGRGSGDRKIKKTLYMRNYMKDYRRGIRRTGKGTGEA